MKYWVLLFPFLLQQNAQAKAEIVTTFSVLENIVQHLVDDEVTVANLVDGGIDPHLFEPGPREINRVRSAKILIANGLYFEPWLNRLLETAPKNLVVVYASRNIKVRKIEEHGVPTEDPHAWNSPGELRNYVEVIAAEIIKAFPDKAIAIGKRSSRFIAEIQAIDSHFKQEFAKIKTQKRVILTTHDAAGYIAEAYAIKPLSPLGLSTAGDFKTADLQKLLAQIKEYELKVIFTEPSHHKVLSERLARKTKVTLGPELYLDGLSPKGGPADTVEKMLRHNLGSILTSMK